ncbi:MAG: hypothetical protein AAF352_03720, partial [Pseudomonadota bacterium]
EPQAAITERYDYHFPMGSLPRLLNLFTEQCPHPLPPYFQVDTKRRDQFAATLQSRFAGKMLIGTSWYTKTNVRRSMDLQRMLPILKTPGCQFIALQYGDIGAQLEELEKTHGISIYRFEDLDVYDDLDGLAALIAALDLVISTPNTTVHITGAVGTMGWNILPFGSDWRWRLEVDRVPWYQTIRLFRQPNWGDWDPVVAEVAKALATTHAQWQYLQDPIVRGRK